MQKLLARVATWLSCGMLLRLVALLLVTLLGRSAFAGSGGVRAPWTGSGRWEATQLSPAQPATRLAVSQGVPATPVWRTVRPGPAVAVAHSLVDALHAARSSGIVRRQCAAQLDAEVRTTSAGRLAFPYDATAPPRA